MTQPRLGDIAPRVAYFGFTGGIESNSVTRICSALNYAINENFDEVYLAFSSPGGYMADGIFLYNHLRAMPIPVTIHATGNIASVAVAIYIGAERRVCSRHVVFMMHPVSIPSGNEHASWERLKGSMDAALAEEKRTENILRERCSIPDDVISTRTYREVLITPQDALKYGLVHDLGELAIPKGAQILQI